MEAIHTHPVTAMQAMAFTAPGSLSFPGGHAELTPPHESFGNESAGDSSQGQKTDKTQQPRSAGSSFEAGGSDAGAVTPATPVATPAAVTTSGSGLVPTLQNIVATVNLDCRLDLKTIALHARNAEYNPKVR